MSTGATKPTPKSSAVAKSGLAVGILAFIGTWWPTVAALMTAGGVPQPTIQKIDTVIKVAQDNSDRLDQLETLIRSLANKPVQVTPQDKPAVNPDVQALQDQIKKLQDQLNQQQQQQQQKPQTPPATSAIKAVDGKGNAVTDTVDEGKQFFVETTVTGGTWTLIKSADQDVDARQYPTEVSCVLRNGADVTVVYSYGSEPIKATYLKVKCNRGGQPPPGPSPINVPPQTKKFTLYVIEDSKIVRTPTTASILANIAARTAIEKRGHTIPQATLNTAGDPAAQYVNSKGTALPALAIMDNDTKQFVQAVPLPTDFGLNIISTIGG